MSEDKALRRKRHRKRMSKQAREADAKRTVRRIMAPSYKVRTVPYTDKVREQS